MGKNPVPLWDYHTKIGEGGWYWEEITRRKGAVSEEWGEAFTSERGAGLAREPGRTPQGGNTRELERPRDYQASPHQQGKGSGAGGEML